MLVVLSVAFAVTIVAWRSAEARIEDVRTLTHFQLVELDQRLRWALEKASWALDTTVLETGDPTAAAPLLERAYASSPLAAAAVPGDGVAQRRYRSLMLANG